MKSDLVENIYRVVEEGYEVTSEQAAEFGKAMGDLITSRLAERGNREFTLRMSNVGKGARQLWYSKRYGSDEKFDGKTLLKFLFGDLTEQLLLFLATLGGNSVTACQTEVVVEGVKGHIDADIDGVTTDVKSASPHAFKKFANGTLAENDPFGYVEQLAGYCEARGTDGAFLAFDKVSGELAHLQFSKEELAAFKVKDRIKYIKDVVESDELPERCYDDEPFQESGNRKLGVNCSYCPFKKRCWQDANGGIGLRTFLYASGPVFLTNVAVEPKVHEVTF